MRKTILHKIFIITLYIPLILSSEFAVSSWRFIVIADWHAAEGFVYHPVSKISSIIEPSRGLTDKLSTIQALYDNYGGELVLLPGDSNGGKWYKSSYLNGLNVKTSEEAVALAGKNCYEGMKYVFQQSGYDLLLMAIGDHELGGNSWPYKEEKTQLLENFRQVFASQFNLSEENKFIYNEYIGDAPSRPISTEFEYTSYATIQQNVLFVTVDVFTSHSKNIFDKYEGIGGEGSVTGSVEDTHLLWFDHVLSEGSKLPYIDHIIVQAHLPIIQPVRKINCSGQFIDYAEHSSFLKVMRKYHVDIYFAGEVHANTATKDPESDLIQIVSRGNNVNNFLTVDVTKDTIIVKCYNEIGSKGRHNNQWEEYGEVIIDKSHNGNNSKIFSEGSLELLNKNEPMLYFNFESVVPLSNRQVLGLKHDSYPNTLDQEEMTIRDIVCKQSIPNKGEYNQPYDAQVGNIQLKRGILGKAGHFQSDSRMAIWGIGPHSGGHAISYALWFKSRHLLNRKFLLIHFGRIFGDNPKETAKNLFTLTLEDGIPALYSKSTRKLEARISPLPSNEWHHVVVTMSRDNCPLSEVYMYINGYRVRSIVKSTVVDRFIHDPLFFHTAGRVSIGGLGHSSTAYDTLFPRHDNYVGKLDEMYIWQRTISSNEVKQLYESVYQTKEPTKTPVSAPTPLFQPKNDDFICQDANTSFFINKYLGKRSCYFVRTHNKQKYCTWVHIKKNCPQTCGICPSRLKEVDVKKEENKEIEQKEENSSCVNSKTLFYINQALGRQSCDYVEHNQKEKYCTWGHIQRKCPKTCGKCTKMDTQPTADPPENKGYNHFCYDKTHSFYINASIGKKTCDFVKNTKYCTWSHIKKKCLRTCGVC